MVCFTKLFYMVNVKPKGPVPVGALEWRIKEDVPTNLRAVKVASEKLPWDCEQDQAALAALAAGRREQQARMTVAQDWMSDETLGAYIGDLQGGGAKECCGLGWAPEDLREEEKEEEV
ncbi:hypothetical protein NGA_0121700 [Nannochloropsis gaditana CCMP526]|uniref:uncharacterized protein n=1 Tax=Nannochloropsis gaditana (strain CCMP526) TaxID=1093141 RepID=UPI00029F5ACE|nr:hypothetical protein NGA_0121700 [Nannochloropsis gaditana CCMP526]EKU20938.1 hypothetical protein NGA_0121700 [Nannochloropsis gaditana CCMP526]|eukprot:XP_005855431.1 hypothetical protein NGA_0121700 [Nannochloropsis gaditana CCMP526]